MPEICGRKNNIYIWCFFSIFKPGNHLINGFNMYRKIFFLFLSTMFLHVAKAEKADSLISYFKNSGKKVLNKDSADFYRVIMPPDTSVDKDLYRVFDYYTDGKARMVATSLTNTASLTLDGICISFFQNGKRKSTAQYKNGVLDGSLVNYYPNGQLYCKLNIENYYNYSDYYYGYFSAPTSGVKIEVLEMRDSTGNLLASNGTGHVIVYDDNFKKVLIEGDMKKNKKEGEWTGSIVDSAKFTCIFHKDEVKSGISYTKSGHQYPFKHPRVEAVFSDGMDAFYIFLKKYMQYPESAKKRHIRGTVSVGFYIDPDGTVSDVTVIRSVVKSLDDEAIRLVKMSPPWIPAQLFGIPVRSHYTVPVNFFY